jgi:hypothetical protein
MYVPCAPFIATAGNIAYYLARMDPCTRALARPNLLDWRPWVRRLWEMPVRGRSSASQSPVQSPSPCFPVRAARKINR